MPLGMIRAPCHPAYLSGREGLEEGRKREEAEEEEGKEEGGREEEEEEEEGGEGL